MVRMNEENIDHLLLEGFATKTLNFKCLDLNIDDAALLLADAIISRRLFAFEHMVFESTNVSTKGIEALVEAAIQCRGLESFNASNNSLQSVCGSKLAKLLQNRGCLKTLNLSKNKLGDVGVSALASAFSMPLANIPSSMTLSLSTLLVLDLSENELGDMAVLSLCRSLSQFANATSNRSGKSISLSTIFLNGNKLSDKAAQCISQLLVPMASTASGSGSGSGFRSGSGSGSNTDQSGLAVINLEYLSLNSNPGIGPIGLNSLINSLVHKHCPLKKLCIADTSPDVLVLENLSSVLTLEACDFELIDLSFSEHVAKNMLSMSSMSSEGEECRLGNCLRSLSRSVRGSNVLKRKKLAGNVNLGKLPEVLCLACIAAGEVDDVKQFYEMALALCALREAETTFLLSDQVSGWIKENADNLTTVVSSPFTSPSQNDKINTVANAIESEVQTISSMTFHSPTPTSSSASPSDLSPNGHYVGDGINAGEDTTAKIQSHVNVKSSKRFTPNPSANSSQDQTNMASLSSVDRRQNGGNNLDLFSPSTSSSSSSSSSYSKPLSRVRNSAAIEQQQEEFERLRQEHSFAFHELADEIHKLIKVPDSVKVSSSSSRRKANNASFESMLPPFTPAPAPTPLASYDSIPQFRSRIEVSDMNLLDSAVKELAVDVDANKTFHLSSFSPAPPISPPLTHNLGSNSNAESIRDFVKESVEMAIGAAQTQWMETITAIIKNREPPPPSSKSYKNDSPSPSPSPSPPPPSRPPLPTDSVHQDEQYTIPIPTPTSIAISASAPANTFSLSVPPASVSSVTKDSFTDAYIMLLQERVMGLEAQAVASASAAAQMQHSNDQKYAQLEARLTTLERMVFMQHQQQVSVMQRQNQHINTISTFAPLPGNSNMHMHMNSTFSDPFDVTIASGRTTPAPPQSLHTQQPATVQTPAPSQASVPALAPASVPASVTIDGSSTSASIDDLQARLAMLEDVLESEHMTTLQVLDSMLAAQQERLQSSPPPIEPMSAPPLLPFAPRQIETNELERNSSNGIRSSSSTQRERASGQSSRSSRSSLGILTPSSPLKPTASSSSRRGSSNQSVSSKTKPMFF